MLHWFMPRLTCKSCNIVKRLAHASLHSFSLLSTLMCFVVKINGGLNNNGVMNKEEKKYHFFLLSYLLCSSKYTEYFHSLESLSRRRQSLADDIDERSDARAKKNASFVCKFIFIDAALQLLLNEFSGVLKKKKKNMDYIKAGCNWNSGARELCWMDAAYVFIVL